ncbi:MAG TPA: Crp/Fnr family transcriptional regulator [Candidatus Angelobacter sp.]|nr:Crp/Fnr family transcriptional regulator [Candidatus Angelobacter sp.]
MGKTPRSRLLEGLNAEELRVILRAAREQRLPAKSVVMDQAQLANKLFLVTHGRARFFLITRDGQRILLRWLVPGDVAGVRAMFLKPQHYHVSTETLKESRVLAWDRKTLWQLTTRYPRLLRNAIYIADDYLEWFVTAHTALTCFTVRQRCASVLKSAAMTIGEKVEGGIEVELTNEDLADASATTLFEASRFISDWRRSGLILKKRGKILVRSMSLLTREITKRR